MVFLVVLLAAVALGLLRGGRLGPLADLRVRHAWLVFAAIAIQVAAFPSGMLPWTVGDGAASVLWLGSYVLIGVAVAANINVPGVVLIGLGMLSNVLAIVANGGRMPALPDAATAAGMLEPAHNNSVTTAEPHLALLVDRWAAPEWIPLANVYSVGDVLLALGGLVLVLVTMGARPPQVVSRALGTAAR
jgi:hypothetical protein